MVVWSLHYTIPEKITVDFLSCVQLHYTINLAFCSARIAFYSCSREHYRDLPTTRLIVQSLIRKWNGCFPEYHIDDTDGQGMDALAVGLLCQRFRLCNQTFYLKGNAIPGFVGTTILENHLHGFHRLLADTLLYFSGYAGVGIKTALGMGGVKYQTLG